jgi:hypothetical protein
MSSEGVGVVVCCPLVLGIHVFWACLSVSLERLWFAASCFHVAIHVYRKLIFWDYSSQIHKLVCFVCHLIHSSFTASRTAISPAVWVDVSTTIVPLLTASRSFSQYVSRQTIRTTGSQARLPTHYAD